MFSCLSYSIINNGKVLDVLIGGRVGQLCSLGLHSIAGCQYTFLPTLPPLKYLGSELACLTDKFPTAPCSVVATAFISIHMHKLGSVNITFELNMYCGFPLLFTKRYGDSRITAGKTGNIWAMKARLPFYSEPIDNAELLFAV